jgi:acyl-coenzyme A synthetase/AMP-(fatty) acid ligase
LAKYKPLIDVVVVPIKDENMIVKSLVAFTLSELSEAQQSFIQNDILATLDNVFFPKKFVTLKEFPYSPSGKLDRNALKKLAKENFS